MLFRAGLIAMVKAAGQRYFSTQDAPQRVVMLNQLAADVCALYGKTPCQVRLEVSTGGALGRCTQDGITLYNKTTFVTFLHELYHWLTLGSRVCNDEQLARQWSLSLFIRACPQRAGKCIIGMGNAQLPDSRANQPMRRLRRAIPIAVQRTADAAAAAPVAAAVQA